MKAAPGESLNIQALQTRALELWDIDKASALELGRALLDVRDAMLGEHGAFARWWRDNELEENRVYYCLRKAEGKIPAAKEAAHEFRLSSKNLAIAEIAPRINDGKFKIPVVKVDENGTTATDGFILARVSLPSGNESVPAVKGLIPSETFKQLQPGDATHSLTVRFRRTGEIVTRSDQIETVFPPSDCNEFPNAEKVFTNFEEKKPTFECSFKVEQLGAIVNALKKFEAKGRVDFRFGNGFVRAIAKSGDQQFTGIIQALQEKKEKGNKK